MSNPPVILLAEDQADDILLTRKALDDGKVVHRLQIVRNGEEAIDYLHGFGNYANRVEYPLPDLMLLDLKMPCLDGFDVLHWARDQPALKALRIVVLTSSDDLDDVTLAYRFGADSFLVKPLTSACCVQIRNALQCDSLWGKTPDECWSGIMPKGVNRE